MQWINPRYTTNGFEEWQGSDHYYFQNHWLSFDRSVNAVSKKRSFSESKLMKKEDIKINLEALHGLFGRLVQSKGQTKAIV